MSLRLAWWVVARVSNALLARASSSAPASAAPSVGSVPLPTCTHKLSKSVHGSLDKAVLSTVSLAKNQNLMCDIVNAGIM